MNRMRIGCFLCVALIAGCNMISDELPQDSYPKPDQVIPKSEPLSKTGNNPYVVDGVLYTPTTETADFTEQGIASWYGNKFHGKKTSSGEVYNMYQYSAAHKTLPIPSYIKVTNLANNKSLIVRVNDRGPFVASRILDLSYAAAKKLGFVSTGTTQIKLESIVPNEAANRPSKPAQVYLQTGVFSSHNNAMQAKRQLESQGYRVVIDQTESSLYKVIVGPFTTPDLAYNEKLDLERKLQQPVMLITDTQ